LRFPKALMHQNNMSGHCFGYSLVYLFNPEPAAPPGQTIYFFTLLRRLLESF
jgi:hypothetical protein